MELKVFICIYILFGTQNLVFGVEGNDGTANWHNEKLGRIFWRRWSWKRDFERMEILHHRQLSGTPDTGPVDAAGEALDGVDAAANDVLYTWAAFWLSVLFEGDKFGDDGSNQVGRFLNSTLSVSN